MYTRKARAYIIGSAAILLALIIVFAQHAGISSYNQTTDTSQSATPTDTAKTFTLADVAMHKSQSSCWTAINGEVYDVTKWIGQPPGGAQAILSLCGTDGSAGFNGQHGGQRRPVTELASFKIGTLTASAK